MRYLSHFPVWLRSFCFAADGHDAMPMPPRAPDHSSLSPAVSLGRGPEMESSDVRAALGAGKFDCGNPPSRQAFRTAAMMWVAPWILRRVPGLADFRASGIQSNCRTNSINSWDSLVGYDSEPEPSCSESRLQAGLAGKGQPAHSPGLAARVASARLWLPLHSMNIPRPSLRFLLAFALLGAGVLIGHYAIPSPDRVPDPAPVNSLAASAGSGATESSALAGLPADGGAGEPFKGSVADLRREAHAAGDWLAAQVRLTVLLARTPAPEIARLVGSLTWRNDLDWRTMWC